MRKKNQALDDRQCVMCWRPRCTDPESYSLTEQFVAEFNKTIPKRTDDMTSRKMSHKEHGLRLRKDFFLGATRQFQTTDNEEIDDAGLLL